MPKTTDPSKPKGATVRQPSDICLACGKPPGTGTLLDIKLLPPARVRASGMSDDAWREFAVRYSCPACAIVRERASAA
jgi:hypothetical protein